MADFALLLSTQTDQLHSDFLPFPTLYLKMINAATVKKPVMLKIQAEWTLLWTANHSNQQNHTAHLYSGTEQLIKRNNLNSVAESYLRPRFASVKLYPLRLRDGESGKPVCG